MDMLPFSWFLISLKVLPLPHLPFWSKNFESSTYVASIFSFPSGLSWSLCGSYHHSYKKLLYAGSGPPFGQSSLYLMVPTLSFSGLFFIRLCNIVFFCAFLGSQVNNLGVFCKPTFHLPSPAPFLWFQRHFNSKCPKWNSWFSCCPNVFLPPSSSS